MVKEINGRPKDVGTRGSVDAEVFALAAAKGALGPNRRQVVRY